MECDLFLSREVKETTKNETKKRLKNEDVILCKDLMSREDIKGGAGRILFEESREPSQAEGSGSRGQGRE